MHVETSPPANELDNVTVRAAKKGIGPLSESGHSSFLRLYQEDGIVSCDRVSSPALPASEGVHFPPVVLETCMTVRCSLWVKYPSPDFANPIA